MASSAKHELVEIVWNFSTYVRYWQCSCGDTGIPVGDIPGVCDGFDRAAAAFRYHANRHAGSDPWPFPSVTYDYQGAGVGWSNRPVEATKDDIHAILIHFKHEGPP